MNATKTGLAANVVGIIGLLLGVFNIDLDQQSQSLLIGAAGVVGLIINQVLIAWAQRQQPAKPDNKLIPEVAQPANNENGFANVRLLALIAGLSIALLSACALQAPQTPRQALLAAYTAAESAANAIEIAKRDGLIDAAKRDELVGSVKQTRELLNASRVLLTNDPATGSVNESEAAANLRAAQNILLAIQAALPREKTP